MNAEQHSIERHRDDSAETADSTAASGAHHVDQQHVDQHHVDQQHDDQDRTSNREAARYRTRLREVESERDGLAARVERMQRADVARLVGDRLAVPDDVFAFGLSLDDLLGGDGDVDPALVDTAVVGLLGARPGLAVAPDKPKFPDLGGGQRGTTPGSSSTWSDVIGERRTRT